MDDSIIHTNTLANHDFSTAYATLALFSSGPLAGQSAAVDCLALGARFELDCELAPLFPYINAVADSAQYYEKPVYIKFLLADRLCAFYSTEGAFTPVRDLAEAMDFLPTLLDFIRDVSRRRPQIVPNNKKYNPTSAVDIYRLLPGSNCRECGFATCLAFAAALSRGRTSMAKCPHMADPLEEKATYPVYDSKGNLLRTVSLDIDTSGLRTKISQKDARIQSLETQLSDFEKRRRANIASANAELPMPLTRREIQVLRRIASGFTNREISSQLNISHHTVKSHVIHIFNKIGVNDRAQASAWGAMHGLIDLLEN
ncbi:LuxR C-terminal-related transcriptional regulator [Desulfosarcina widdelii]|nr:LuxR C-terminal-related transcriptional regulator [Desulfosarcina widdelii]